MKKFFSFWLIHFMILSIFFFSLILIFRFCYSFMNSIEFIFKTVKMKLMQCISNGISSLVDNWGFIFKHRPNRIICQNFQRILFDYISWAGHNFWRSKHMTPNDTAEHSNGENKQSNRQKTEMVTVFYGDTVWVLRETLSISQVCSVTFF